MEYINMVAPYQGVLVWVGNPKEGTSQSGNEWKSVNFTIKYLDSQMREQHITFTLAGAEKVNRLLALQMGSEIKVFWRPVSNRYVDREGVEQWFPQLSAFSITSLRKEEIQDLPEATEPADTYRAPQPQRRQAPRSPADEVPF